MAKSWSGTESRSSSSIWSSINVAPQALKPARRAPTGHATATDSRSDAPALRVVDLRAVTSAHVLTPTLHEHFVRLADEEEMKTARRSVRALDRSDVERHPLAWRADGRDERQATRPGIFILHE